MSVSPQTVSAAERRVGTLLKGKWTIDAILGTGGMATVYAATHRNKKRVAIKVLHPEVSLSEDVTTRFLREGYVANTVDHPGAVTVLDDDVTDDGAPFLVMELLEGETTEQRRERKGGRLLAGEVLWAAEQVLEVLVAAHAKGVVHRDLKPENIFITSDNRLKVLDFGIARLRDVSLGSSVGTQTGSLLGTPAFMAPEQARGRSELVDARTDIWAVGATMFQLLAGRAVHEAQTLNEQLIYAATKPAVSLGDAAPELPRDLVAIVDRALAFEKEDRWPDAASMLSAVRALLDRDGRLTSLSVLPPGVGLQALPSSPGSAAPAAAKTAATMSIPPTGSIPPRSDALSTAALEPGARPGSNRRAAFVAIAAVASAATLGLVLLARSPQATPSAVAETQGSPPSPQLMAQATAQPAAQAAQPPSSASAAPPPLSPAAPATSAPSPERPQASGGAGAGSKSGRTGAKPPAPPSPPSPPATTAQKPPAPPATAPPSPPANGNPFDRRF